MIVIDPSVHTTVNLYLDPGTGSIILQVVIATLMGSTLAAKIYWTKLKALFSRWFRR